MLLIPISSVKALLSGLRPNLIPISVISCFQKKKLPQFNMIYVALLDQESLFSTGVYPGFMSSLKSESPQSTRWQPPMLSATTVVPGWINPNSWDLWKHPVHNDSYTYHIYIINITYIDYISYLSNIHIMWIVWIMYIIPINHISCIWYISNIVS